MESRTVEDGQDITPADYLDRQAEREVEIAQRLEGLHSRNARVREHAARRLGELRAPCLPALLEAIGDPNPYVRSATAEALGRTQPEAVLAEVIDCLLAAIDDCNSHVVVAAIRSLGWLRAEASRQQIVDCLDDANPYVAAAAIRALARLGPPAPVERLAEFLDSGNPHLRASAARVVGALGYTPAVPRLLRNLEAALMGGPGGGYGLSFCHIEALVQLDAREAIPLLLDTARHQVGLRSRAVLALLRLQAQEAVPVLANLLADPSSSLRLSLVKMMVQSGYRVALPAIRPLLTDPNSQLRLAALQAVTEWQDPVSIERVRWLAYHDPSSLIRVQAVHSLASLAEPQAVTDLVSFLGDLNTRVRLTAVTELGRIEEPSSEIVTGLQHLAAQEEVPAVAEAVRAALARSGNVPIAPHPPAAPPAPPVPAALHAEAPALLAGLVRWQEALPALLGKSDLAEIARIDTALTALITTLRLHASTG